MYESPIEVMTRDMQIQVEQDVVKAVQRYDINVNKDEIIKALQYDRNQYIKGYEDGKKEVIDEIIKTILNLGGRDVNI